MMRLTANNEVPCSYVESNAGDDKKLLFYFAWPKYREYSTWFEDHQGCRQWFTSIHFI